MNQVFNIEVESEGGGTRALETFPSEREDKEALDNEGEPQISLNALMEYTGSVGDTHRIRCILGVRVANEERLVCREKYEEVRLSIQGLEFAATLFSLPLNRLDGEERMTMTVEWGN